MEINPASYLLPVTSSHPYQSRVISYTKYPILWLQCQRG